MTHAIGNKTFWVRPTFIETDEARAKRLGRLAILPERLAPKKRWICDETERVSAISLLQGKWDDSRSVWEGWN